MSGVNDGAARCASFNFDWLRGGSARNDQLYESACPGRSETLELPSSWTATPTCAAAGVAMVATGGETLEAHATAASSRALVAERVNLEARGE